MKPSIGLRFLQSRTSRRWWRLWPGGCGRSETATDPSCDYARTNCFLRHGLAAAKYLSENSAEGHRRVILVISDGDDNFSSVIRDLTVAEVRASQRGELTPRQRARACRIAGNVRWLKCKGGAAG